MSDGSRATPTRTQRRHLETVEEVKEIARERLGQDGLSGLSLRAIARDMGVVPSALYRYFPSHAHLLDAIAGDAAASMLDHIRRAIEALPESDCLGRWLAGMRAYRSWALEHTPGYSLNFGDLSGERSDGGEPNTIVAEVVNVLAEVVVAGERSGQVDQPYAGVGKDITQHLDDDTAPKNGIPPRVLASTLTAWTSMHGTVALEVSGHLPDLGIDDDTFFEGRLIGVTRAMGFRVDS